jgi:hypothetical protein
MTDTRELSVICVLPMLWGNPAELPAHGMQLVLDMEDAGDQRSRHEPNLALLVGHNANVLADSKGSTALPADSPSTVVLSVVASVLTMAVMERSSLLMASSFVKQTSRAPGRENASAASQQACASATSMFLVLRVIPATSRGMARRARLSVLGTKLASLQGDVWEMDHVNAAQAASGNTAQSARLACTAALVAQGLVQFLVILRSLALDTAGAREMHRVSAFQGGSDHRATRVLQDILVAIAIARALMTPLAVGMEYAALKVLACVILVSGEPRAKLALKRSMRWPPAIRRALLLRPVEELVAALTTAPAAAFPRLTAAM